MRRFITSLVVLACGGTVVPEPPPPHHYQVGFAHLFEVEVWHSSTATVALPGPYVDGPVFTHDGRLFVALTNADFNDPANARELAFATSSGATVRTVPFLGWFGVRGDGNRLTLVDKMNGTLMTWDVDGTLGPPLATNVFERALYAPDDTTVVFTRGGQVVTMRDDGTNEEIFATSDASDPTFSWDGTRIVYVRSRTDVEAIDRATHVIQPLFTASFPERVWSASLTPDGAYLVVLVGKDYGPFSIEREEIATQSIDVIRQNLSSGLESGWPGFELSVAPDVTSK